MDEQQVEPSGPPPVKKGTKIAIQGAEAESVPLKTATVKNLKPAVDSSAETETAPGEIPEPPVSGGIDAPAPTEQPTEQPEQVNNLNDSQSASPDSGLPPRTAIDEDLAAIDMEDEQQPPSNIAKPTKPPKPPKVKKPRKGKKVVIILLVLLLIAGAAGGAWWFLKKPASSGPSTTVPTNSNNQSTTNQPATQPETVTVKTFKSTTLGVELSYPSNWKTNENGNSVVFSSPEISYTKKDGTTAKGSYRLIVQKGYTQNDSTTINNSVAVKTSELVKYTAPATGQRTESYLSFLGTDKQTFRFIMVTSGKQYNPGDTVAATLPLTQDSYIVVGGYGKGSGENIDFDALSPDKIQQNEAYTQSVDIIKSLKITS